MSSSYEIPPVAGADLILGKAGSHFAYTEDAAHVMANAVRLLEHTIQNFKERGPSWTYGNVLLLAELHHSGYFGPIIYDDENDAWASRVDNWTDHVSWLLADLDRGGPRLSQHTAKALSAISGTTTVLTVPHLLYLALVPFNGYPLEPPPDLSPPGLLDPYALARRALDQLGPDAYRIEPTLDRPQPAQTVRPTSLSSEAAGRTAAAFEIPLAALTEISLDPSVAEWDAEFVRNTLQQIALWHQRDDANPQILELLLADVVMRLHERLSDTAVLQASLVELGADEAIAAEVARRTSEALNEVSQLGGGNPASDGARIDRIANDVDQIARVTADALAGDGGHSDQGEHSDERKVRYRTAIVEGVANGVATTAVTAIATFTGDHWTQVQLGLIAAWTWVRAIWA